MFSKNMIYLNKTDTSSAVTSFWIVVAGIILAASGVLHFLWDTPRIVFVSGIFLILALGVTFWIRPILARTIYRNYNALVLRVIVPTAVEWVALVAYFSVFVPNRGFGRRRIEELEAQFLQSMWRDAGGGGTNGLHENTAQELPKMLVEDFSLRWFAKWTKTSGNRWALALAPYILILRFLDKPLADEKRRSDTYTLY